VTPVSSFVDNGDARIHVVDSGGDDRGAPVVFVPGMTCLAADYAMVLSSFGRRTVVVDVRGHGPSNSPAAGYDLEALVSDVAAVVDHVTDGPVHLVTFSRGTSCAIAWTLRDPGRVRSLSIGDYVPEERVLTAGMAERLLSGRWRGSPVADRLDSTAAMATFAAARPQSFWEPLARLGLPLLVVRSGEGILITDDEWARYRTLFPHARLVTFDDSPHDVFRPERDRYPRMVCEHVDRADGRA
jgi:pimeloyl-ACP methyl ester carboxylesterase